MSSKTIYDYFDEYEKKMKKKETDSLYNDKVDIIKKLSETINSKVFKNEYQNEFYDAKSNTYYKDIVFDKAAGPSTTGTFAYYQDKPISVPEMIKDVDKFDNKLNDILFGFSTPFGTAEKEIGPNAMNKIEADLKQIDAQTLSQQKVEKLKELLNEKLKQIKDAEQKEKDKKAAEPEVNPLSRFDLMDI